MRAFSQKRSPTMFFAIILCNQNLVKPQKREFIESESPSMEILRYKISSVNLCLEALALSNSVEVNTQVCLRSDALALGVNFRGGVRAHGGQFDVGDFLTSPLDPGGDFWTTTQPPEPFDLIQVEGRRYPMEVHLVHKVISLSSQGLIMHTFAIGCIG